jgi:hypothetical protein
LVFILVLVASFVGHQHQKISDLRGCAALQTTQWGYCISHPDVAAIDHGAEPAITAALMAGTPAAPAARAPW